MSGLTLHIWGFQYGCPCGVSVWLHYLEPLGVALLLLNGRRFVVARILEW
jgi:hypothetical protein